MKLRLLSCLALVLAGCFSPDYQNGKSECGPGGACPDGYTCAADNHCYVNGTQPSDLSVIDQETPPDLLPACGPTQHLCAGACADNSSVLTCGTSTCTPCPLPANGSSTTCDGTSCGFICNAGFHTCGDSCLDNTSVSSCGVSCTPCANISNATTSCVSGSCSYACDPGYRLCGGACITDATPCGTFCGTGRHLCSSMCVVDNDLNNCGTTSAACSPCPTPPSGHGSATCTGSTPACGITCVAGYHLCGGDCRADGDPAFGCGSAACAACAAPDGGSAQCVSVADGGSALQCNTLQPNGVACAAGAECNSGICTPGQSGSICASVNCPIACSVVNAAGSACIAATTATDPKNDCTASVATCKQANCNGSTGATACNVADNTSCGASSCSGTTQTNQVCVTGSCTMPTAGCNGFTCGATTCNTTCTVATNAGCDATHYCVGGNSCMPRQANGASCAFAFQCTNNNCTQGQSGLICASVACPTACSVVNAAGTTCVAATNNTDPKNDCTASAATCKQDNCNGTTGATACNVADNTSCGASSCSGSTQTNQVCVTGACTMPTVGCNGFTCGATTCNTTCTVATNAGCDATHYCVGGNSCMPRQTNGASCAFAFQCANNNCTQGQGGLICASVACPTACSVVNAAGTTCVAATNGSDPKNDCTVSVANCKQDNCNGSTGANACNVSDNTSCGTPSCTAGTETDQLCMTGTCTSTPKNCNNFMCTVPGSGGVCVTSCTVGADTGCKMGFYCVAGTSCVAKGGPGAVCAAADQCTSGLCGTTGSGHCCTAACTTGGTCGATDCNPIGACAYPTGTTSCGAGASCSGSMLTPVGTCNGGGSCTAGTPAPCANNFSCASATACATMCTPGTDAGCDPSAYCAGGGTMCRPKNVTGPCGANDQCTSGVCGTTGSGSCCASACTTGGACGATGCNNGTGACVYPTGTTSCGAAASCSGSTLTPTGSCNSNGSCNAGTPAACAGNFACASGTTCGTTCNTVDGSGCDATHYCSGATTCSPLIAVGSSCTADFQCATGSSCAQGQSGKICATVTCPAQCQVVAAGGTSCTAAMAGSDPKSNCTANVATCKQATCNGGTGATACDVPDTTSCGAPTCSAGSETDLVCSGGACGTVPVPCNGFSCNGTTICDITCTVGSDAGCEPNFYCVGGNMCVAKGNAGAICGANDQCKAPGVCGATGTGHCCAASCSTAGTCGASDCDGTGACNYPSGSTSCGSVMCTGSSLTPLGSCNGSGGCTATPGPCPGNFACDTSTSCATTCGADAPAGDLLCASGHYCDGTNCQPPQAMGATCTRASQCVSASCNVGLTCD